MLLGRCSMAWPITFVSASSWFDKSVSKLHYFNTVKLSATSSLEITISSLLRRSRISSFSSSMVWKISSVNLVLFSPHSKNRYSHQRCSVKKGALRNVTKFTGKHLWQSPFFNKVAGLHNYLVLEDLLQIAICFGEADQVFFSKAITVTIRKSFVTRFMKSKFTWYEIYNFILTIK